MNSRPWIYAGSICGAISLVLLTVLVTLAFGTPKPSLPALLVVAVGCILSGAVSLKLLGDAWTLTTIERCTNRYVHGVSDTVDRLASALPGKDNVRRIG